MVQHLVEEHQRHVQLFLVEDLQPRLHVIPQLFPAHWQVVLGQPVTEEDGPRDGSLGGGGGGGGGRGEGGGREGKGGREGEGREGEGGGGKGGGGREGDSVITHSVNSGFQGQIGCETATYILDSPPKKHSVCLKDGTSTCVCVTSYMHV